MKSCKICKSTDNIDRHHIIPIEALITFYPLSVVREDSKNKVFLCRNHHTEVMRLTLVILKMYELVLYNLRSKFSEFTIFTDNKAKSIVDFTLIWTLSDSFLQGIKEYLDKQSNKSLKKT